MHFAFNHRRPGPVPASSAIPSPSASCGTPQLCLCTQRSTSRFPHPFSSFASPLAVAPADAARRRRPAATMRPSPLLTALGASAGTFVVLGGATFVVSGVALSVAKRVVRSRRVSQCRRSLLVLGISAHRCHAVACLGFLQSCNTLQWSLTPPHVCRMQQRRHVRSAPAAASSPARYAWVSRSQLCCPCCWLPCPCPSQGPAAVCLPKLLQLPTCRRPRRAALPSTRAAQPAGSKAAAAGGRQRSIGGAACAVLLPWLRHHAAAALPELPRRGPSMPARLNCRPLQLPCAISTPIRRYHRNHH